MLSIEYYRLYSLKKISVILFFLKKEIISIIIFLKEEIISIIYKAIFCHDQIYGQILFIIYKNLSQIKNSIDLYHKYHYHFFLISEAFLGLKTRYQVEPTK